MSVGGSPHPFWLVNSILVLLCAAVLSYAFFSRQRVPAREDIEGSPYIKPVIKESSKVNIAKIYEEDLFGTYQQELPTIESVEISAFPEPPRPTQVTIPEEPKPQFLEPLGITLRGVIIVLDDDERNRAIIADNKTNQEATYKVGDRIEDAQLIRIFNNKVLFLRSNGQQEMIFLREGDAKKDPLYASLDNWSQIVQSIGPNQYRIIINEFVQRVGSLGQFIDMLDLTTVYKQGESIGTRIGQMNGESLGLALGLQKGDIITSINAKPIATTQDRFTLYQEIINLKTNDVVSVNLLRNNHLLTLSYTLQEVIPQQRKQEPLIPLGNGPTKEQIKELEKTKTLAPTLQQIQAQERNLMIEKGKRPTQNVLSHISE